MSTLGETFIVLMLTATIGAATYEARQTFQLRALVHSVKQQQAPIVKQIEQLQLERDEAINRMALLLEENAQLKSNTVELRQLQSEVTRWDATKNQKESDLSQSAVTSWLGRVNQLKQYVEQHPDEGIPEFQFLTDREWLLIAASDRLGADWGDAVEDLKSQAEDRFAVVVQNALQKYAQANSGQFPSDVSQLQPDCDANVEDILQQRYEIKPASILPASSVKDQDIKTDWVIAGKEPIAKNSGDHLAIYANGHTFFW